MARGGQLSKVESADQRMRLECGVAFCQLRTCRRARPGQLCVMSGTRGPLLHLLSSLVQEGIFIEAFV